MRDRWEGIDEFVAVATMGSFAAGAMSLRTSASQVSRKIARLEANLQTQLFYRTTRTVTLTDTGRVLVERCREVIQQRDEALDSVAGGDEPQGELRLTCSTAVGVRFVAPIVARVAQRYAKLSVTMELSNRIIDLVGEGFDLAVRTGKLSDSRLVATRIASRRLYLCASPKYLATIRAPSTVGDLANLDCVVGNAATWHFAVDRTEVSIRPTGRWQCNSGEAVLEAVLAGLGLCQLPEFYVLPYLASGLLVELLPDARPQDEPVWAVYPERRHLLPKVRVLVEWLKRELGPAINNEN